MSPLNPVQKFIQVSGKSERVLIGLMSGMSMDGVDVACIRVQGKFPDLEVERLGTHFRPFRPAFRERLLRGRRCGVEEVSDLNFLVGDEFALAVHEFLEKSGLRPCDIDAIGSHGQTLAHRTRQDGQVASSLQVGSPSIIAEKTGILCIGNFRVRDIAAGGQGAPLVAYADYLRHREARDAVLLNNLGSISNVTVVTPRFEDLLAFDTGPANLFIDHFARLVPGNVSGLDEGGALSAGGSLQAPLLEEWLSLPFFAAPPPKAAGYDDLDPQRLMSGPIARSRPWLPLDLLKTSVELSARSLGDAYERYVLPRHSPVSKVIFSGGGVYNVTLMEAIRRELDGLRVEILPPEEADSREAVAFALLANAALNGESNNAPLTTGATHPVVMGEFGL